MDDCVVVTVSTSDGEVHHAFTVPFSQLFAEAKDFAGYDGDQTPTAATGLVAAVISNNLPTEND